MNRALFIIAIIAILLVSSMGQAKTIEVPVSQISVISPGPHEQDLSLGPRVCLRFELPQEVDSTEIGFAELVAYLMLPVVTEDSLVIFEAYSLSSDWNEGVRWNDFASPGGDIDSNFYATYTHKCGRDSIASFDITPIAQKWHELPESNHGILIIPRMTDFLSFRQFQLLPGQLRNLITLKILVPGRDD